MDGKSTWQWKCPNLVNIRSPLSFQIFTDGGRRDSSTASAAWVIFIIIKGGFKLVGHGAKFVHGIDSFSSEALAVELALKHQTIICNAATNSFRLA